MVVTINTDDLKAKDSVPQNCGVGVDKVVSVDWFIRNTDKSKGARAVI